MRKTVLTRTALQVAGNVHYSRRRIVLVETN